MRTETITKQFKKFDELNKEQKQKAIQDNAEINLNHDLNFELTVEDYMEDIKTQTGFDIPYKAIVWSIGGRDACLGVHSDELLNCITEEYDEVTDVILPRKVGVGLNHRGGGICTPTHTEHNGATVYTQNNADLTVEVNKKINIVIDLSLKYFHILNEVYDYLLSDESIAETLRANEMEFEV